MPSTDTPLNENESIRIYGKRWDIEVFFKVCKSYLNLSRKCNDNRSLGELFLYFSDEYIARFAKNISSIRCL